MSKKQPKDWNKPKYDRQKEFIRLLELQARKMILPEPLLCGD